MWLMKEPRYHGLEEYLESNQRETSCFITPRSMQCIEWNTIPRMMSKVDKIRFKMENPFTPFTAYLHLFASSAFRSTDYSNHKLLTMGYFFLSEGGSSRTMNWTSQREIAVFLKVTTPSVDPKREMAYSPFLLLENSEYICPSQTSEITFPNELLPSIRFMYFSTPKHSRIIVWSRWSILGHFRD